MRILPPLASAPSSWPVTVRCDRERVEYYRRAFERYRALYPALRDWYSLMSEREAISP